MATRLLVSALISMAAFASSAHADLAMRTVVLDQTIAHLPTAETNELRVLTATLNPGDKTPAHTHRYPATAYVVEGTFTLEVKGKPPLTVEAGHAFVEAAGEEATGYNRSADKVAKVVIFYVSAADTPFIDPVK